MARARTRYMWIGAIVAAAGGGAFLADAGPLNPPGGPVASTLKTLSDVEPRTAINATNTPGTATSVYRITQPGSYYLTGNLTGASGKNGIEIVSGGVTVDLNGFALTGVAGSLDGVATTQANFSNIAVVNGTVTNWNGDGIDLQTTAAINCRIVDVQANANTGIGIRAGNAFIMDRCGARGNGAGGLASNSQGVISHCEAVSNTGTGMALGQGITVIGCTSSFNFGGVADGITMGGFGSTIVDCMVSNNPGNGIVVNNGSGAVISRCSINGNSLAGIQAAGGTAISDCAVNFSQTYNIIVADGSIVERCDVQFGNQGGIRCGGRNVIRDNVCDSNANGSGTGPNILVTGPDNRVEGNNCTGAFRGIKVDVAGNFIARNTCSGNSNNYELVAGNSCFVVFATNSGAILGSSGGVSVGSTDPNANFSY